MEGTEGKKFDWGEMLSITGQEKKKYKNADRMYEIVTELSNLDSWITEATRKKGELEDTNARLEAKKNELTQAVKDAKSVHAGIMGDAETLRFEVVSLRSILDSSDTERRAEIEKDLQVFKDEMKADKESIMARMNDEIHAKDSELEAVNNKVSNAKEALSNIKLGIDV